MRLMFVPVALLLIAAALVDGFEAMVLPRRVTHGYRPARLYYKTVWRLWGWLAARLPGGRRRESFLAIFGPLSLLCLFALWASMLIAGFGLLKWSAELPLNAPPVGGVTFGTYLYYSGVTFFTLGYGDVIPATAWGRALAVIEAGVGLGFMAVIIGYLPSLSQAASQRELTISLLDARAGSPPTAAEGILRAARAGHIAGVETFLAEWERWAAQLLESHLSFPVLVYYRSQHDNQSWLAALTAVLDGCALFIAGVKGVDPYQAQLTFAIARHVLVDLSLVLRVPPESAVHDRLSTEQFKRLRELLCEAGLALESDEFEKKYAELRAMYEPFAAGLAKYLLFALPPILSTVHTVDNWQTSPWTPRTPGIGALQSVEGDEHFR